MLRPPQDEAEQRCINSIEISFSAADFKFLQQLQHAREGT
jgi:hypothetical protein